MYLVCGLYFADPLIFPSASLQRHSPLIPLLISHLYISLSAVSPSSGVLRMTYFTELHGGSSVAKLHRVKLLKWRQNIHCLKEN